jgi:hypothetical protein
VLNTCPTGISLKNRKASTINVAAIPKVVNMETDAMPKKNIGIALLDQFLFFSKFRLIFF